MVTFERLSAEPFRIASTTSSDNVAEEINSRDFEMHTLADGDKKESYEWVDEGGFTVSFNCRELDPPLKSAKLIDLGGSEKRAG
jgi:hypothetical protein